MSAGEFPDVQPLLDAAEALGFGNATLQSGSLIVWVYNVRD